MNNLFGTIAFPYLLIIIACTSFSMQAQTAEKMLARQYWERADSLSEEANFEAALSFLVLADSLFEKHKQWADFIETKIAIIETKYRLKQFNNTGQTIDIAIQKSEEQFGKSSYLYCKSVLTKAKALYFQKEIEEGLRLVNTAYPIIESITTNKDALLINYYNTSANLYGFGLRQYDKAIDLQYKAIEISELTYGKNSLETAYMYDDIAAMLSRVRQLSISVDFNHKSIAIKEQQLKRKDHPELAINFNNLGINYLKLSQYHKAKDFFDRAYSIDIKHYDQHHPVMLKYLSYLGTTYLLLEDYQLAIDYLKKEVNYRIANRHDPITLAKSHLRLGAVYLMQNDARQSLENYHIALSKLCNNLSEANIYSSPQIDDVNYPILATSYISSKLEAIYLLVSQEPGNMQAIHTGIALGELTLELWKEIQYILENQLQTKKERIENIRYILKQSALIAYQGYKHTKDDKYAEKSFQLAEWGKALLLQEASLKANAYQFIDLPEQVLEEEKKHTQLLAAYEEQLLTALNQNDTQRINSIRNHDLFYAKLDYEKFLNKLHESYPEYFELKYDITKVSIEQIQAVLKEDEIYVDYHIIEEPNEILTFIVDKTKGLSIYNTQYDAQKLEDAANFNKLLRSYLLGRADKKRHFIKLSHQFYQLLVQPLEKHLIGKRKMILTGENFTHYIPFEVLLTSNKNEPFNEMDFLIKELEISYHYSAPLYLKAQKQEQSFSNDLLAFAPVFEDQTNQTASLRNIPSIDTTLRSIDEDGKFRPLLHTQLEVENIVKLFQQKTPDNKTTILLRNDATEGNLKDALIKNHRFVHLASHSFSNLEQPELSGIACISTTSTDKENGVLFSGEIYNMAINSDLLVLSSCESGVGELLAGEGMLGLNRSFVYAGVPNVVFSLWKVFDHITKDMMTQFYQYILEGHSYATALRLTKLDMLQKEATASPEFWGAFLLIGR